MLGVNIALDRLSHKVRIHSAMWIGNGGMLWLSPALVVDKFVTVVAMSEFSGTPATKYRSGKRIGVAEL